MDDSKKNKFFLLVGFHEIKFTALNENNEILLDKEFISITKHKNTSWDSLRTMISSQIGSYLEKNDSLLIVEKELNEINLQSKEHNSSIDQSILQEKINQLVDQFNEFSEKNCSDKDYLSKFKKLVAILCQPRQAGL